MAGPAWCRWLWCRYMDAAVVRDTVHGYQEELQRIAWANTHLLHDSRIQDFVRDRLLLSMGAFYVMSLYVMGFYAVGF